MESKYAGMSSYNYSFNNPVMVGDPDGADPKDKKNQSKGEKTKPSETNPSSSSLNLPSTSVLKDGPLTTADINTRQTKNNDDVKEQLAVEAEEKRKEELSKPTIMSQDRFGNVYSGTEENVEKTMILVEQQYQEQVGENVRNSFWGAVGYIADGERGSFIGAGIGGVVMSFGGPGSPKGQVEKPVEAKVEEVTAEQRPSEKYEFQKLGYSYKPVTKVGLNETSVAHVLESSNEAITVGFSSISKEGTLTNLFEVPVSLQRKGVSTAMYRYLDKLGVNTIIGSYNPSSDNYKVFMSLYNPFKANETNAAIAAMAMPAAIAMGKAYFPLSINVRSEKDKVKNISIIWQRR